MKTPTTPNAWDGLKPSDTIPKGFIEITPYKDVRLLVALTAIVGLTDEGDKGCVLTLSAPVMVNGAESFFLLKQPYAEVVALIREAR